MKYVSLHTHSTYSYGDGYGPVSYHVDTVADLGMTSLALTEHGNVSSWVDLEKNCKRRGIKPIFGCEIYTGVPNQPKKCHMIVLAMNEQGLHNLNKIVTEAWKTLGTTSKSKFPTVYWPILKRYNAGITALSGCSDSALNCTLLGGKYFGDKRLECTDRDINAGIRLVQRYQEVFDDRIYIEVQRFPGLERTCALNPALAEISSRTGALLAATADVHYPNPSENAMQRILHAAHRGGTVESADADWEYNILLTYPRSDVEILKDLEDTGLSIAQARASVTSTQRIAERCNVELPKATPQRYIIDQDRDWKPWN